MKTEIEHCRHFDVGMLMCLKTCPKHKQWNDVYVHMYCIKDDYTADCEYYED